MCISPRHSPALTYDVPATDSRLLVRQLGVQSHRRHVLENDVTQRTLFDVTQIGQVELDVLVGGGDVPTQAARLLEPGTQQRLAFLDRTVNTYEIARRLLTSTILCSLHLNKVNRLWCISPRCMTGHQG